MARKLRIQYPGALYHVINRGNYRRDIFETTGATTSFEATLDEACTRYGWRIHAHVIMRNHYHLALETPEAKLVDGMHWLQGTFATRFNRYRRKHGHLFQGRYQALLVENVAALARVVSYIDLNPVRAGIVDAAAVATFPSGSLRHLVQRERPPWLVAGTILDQLELNDTTSGWAKYVEYLTALAGDPKWQKQLGFETMCRGWAIGTPGWREALAREYAHLALAAGFEREELREIKEARWRDVLHAALRERNLVLADVISGASSARTKIELAGELRKQVSAPYRWIASTLVIDQPQSLRMQIHRRSLQVSP